MFSLENAIKKVTQRETKWSKMLVKLLSMAPFDLSKYNVLLPESRNNDCLAVSIMLILLGLECNPSEGPMQNNIDAYLSAMGFSEISNRSDAERLINSRMTADEVSMRPKDMEAHATLYNVTIIEGDVHTIRVVLKTNPDVQWTVECKLSRQEITEKLIQQLIPVLEKFPVGKSVSLQVDTHSAGHIFVGMVCSCEGTRIPMVIVSADIGCGMAMMPIIVNGRQLESSTLTGWKKRAFLIRIARIARQVLARGKVSEEGKTKLPLDLVSKVLSFYGTRDIGQYLAEFNKLLSDPRLELLTPQHLKAILRDNSASVDQLITSLDLLSQVGGDLDLAKERAATLIHILGYGCTLGSSGNHFLEIAEKNGKLFVVTHSGSRALGAAVYKKILDLTALSGSTGMATGELAHFYSWAYDLLNQFAQINRLLCAMAVAQAMGWDTDPEILRKAMVADETFAPVSEMFSGEEAEKAINVLLKGLTHNGVKCFRQWDESGKTTRILFLCVKGAVAVSRRAATVLVALKMGEGCAVFAECNPSINCEEIPLEEGHNLLKAGVPSDTNISNWKELVALYGHGAGRCCSASENFKKFEWTDLVSYLNERGVIANMGPGLLPDHPSGYKDAKKVLKRLPPGAQLLTTMLGWKECISHQPKHIDKMYQFLDKIFTSNRRIEDLSDETKLLLGQIDWQLIGFKFKDAPEVQALMNAIGQYWDDQYDQLLPSAVIAA